jgi:glycosyltransferase involved in cell wall biosynthesis
MTIGLWLLAALNASKHHWQRGWWVLGIRYQRSLKDQKKKYLELPKNVDVITAYRVGEGLPFLRFIYPKIIGVWRALSIADADIYFVRAASYLAALVALWCKIHKKPWIYSGAHDTDFIPGAELIGNFRDRFLYRWGLKRADLILGQSQSQQMLCQSNYGLDLTVLNNYSPDPIVTPIKTDGPIVWVSTIRRWKRPERLLELAKMLPEKMFIMIGGRDSQNPAYFNSIKREAKLLPNVQFMGFLPPTEVESTLNSALVLLNTSELEGFPNTFLQAWRRGLPVISFFDPGGVVSKNRLGFIVDSSQAASEIAKKLYLSWTLDNARHVQTYYRNNHQEGVIYQLSSHMKRLYERKSI